MLKDGRCTDKPVVQVMSTVETEVVAGSRGREEHQKQKGQVETEVVAGSRGWEEYQRKFPHQASIQRHMRWEKLSKCWPVKEWVEGGDESELKAGEGELVKKRERIARTRAGGDVAERGWGASEGGDVLQVISIYLYSVLFYCIAPPFLWAKNANKTPLGLLTLI